MKYLKIGRFRIGVATPRGLHDILVYLHWGNHFSSWRVYRGRPWLLRKGEAPFSKHLFVRAFQTKHPITNR